VLSGNAQVAVSAGYKQNVVGFGWHGEMRLEKPIHERIGRRFPTSHFIGHL
jgi:hypothetical protein